VETIPGVVYHNNNSSNNNNNNNNNEKTLYSQDQEKKLLVRGIYWLRRELLFHSFTPGKQEDGNISVRESSD